MNFLNKLKDKIYPSRITKMKRITHHLFDLFIPHHKNNHWPLVLRPRVLLSYGVTLIIVKLLISSFLFISFPTLGKFSKDLIDELILLVNTTRSENGLSKLTLSQTLSDFANSKAKDMIDKGYFSHYTPEGYDPWYFFDEVQYPYELAGENLAMNFTNARIVHEAFLASPSHRANLLNLKFQDIGLAVAYGKINERNTQVLVEFFGKPKLAPALLEEQEPKLVKSQTTVVPPAQKQPLQQQILGETVQELKPLTQNKFTFNQELVVLPFSLSENLATKLFRWSHRLFIFFLIFLIISFLINIVIKIRIQHGRLIIQTVILIGFTVGLLFLKIHFLETLDPYITIF